MKRVKTVVMQWREIHFIESVKLLDWLWCLCYWIRIKFPNTVLPVRGFNTWELIITWTRGIFSSLPAIGFESLFYQLAVQFDQTTKNKKLPHVKRRRRWGNFSVNSDSIRMPWAKFYYLWCERKQAGMNKFGYNQPIGGSISIVLAKTIQWCLEKLWKHFYLWNKPRRFCSLL